MPSYSEELCDEVENAGLASYSEELCDEVENAGPASYSEVSVIFWRTFLLYDSSSHMMKNQTMDNISFYQRSIR